MIKRLIFAILVGLMCFAYLPFGVVSVQEGLCAENKKKTVKKKSTKKTVKAKKSGVKKKVVKKKSSKKKVKKKSSSKKKKAVVKKKSKKKIQKKSKKKRKSSRKTRKKPVSYNTFKGDDFHNVEMVKKAVARDWVGAQKTINKTKNRGFSKTVYYLTRIYYEPEKLRLHEIKSFFDKNAWIPKAPFLAKIERNVDFNKEPNKEVVEWFNDHEPTTDNGKFILLDALVNVGEVDLKSPKEIKYVRAMWRKTNFNDVVEDKFLKKYRSHLDVSDLLKKIETLTWNKQYTRAGKLISILPAKYSQLPKERLNLARGHKSNANRVQKSLKRYPKDPYFQHQYVRVLQKAGKEKAAIKALLKYKASSANPKWWRVKNLAIRDALKLKMYREAYKLSTNHKLPYGADMAEAEWLAGWISLRFLKKPQTAVLHFEKLYNETKFASSKSKASYWLARSHEAMGDYNSAQGWYYKSASYKGTFYGTMAIAQNNGNEQINYFADNDESADNEWATYVDKESAKMITHLAAILHEARVYRLVDKLFYSVAEMDLHPRDLRTYVKMLENWDKNPLAVRFTRTVSNRGAALVRDGYPYKKVSIDRSSKLPKSVYLGLIRQESNFDKNAVSSAGARGLMQIMPGTAKRVAKMHKIKQKDYAHNPKTNVLYGVKYLDHLYGSYNNLPMAIAAYNAGPGNVNKWVKRYGDPRKLKSTYEVIDWIESIPYSETRNYVKSVLENVTIYDSILSKKHKPENIFGLLSQ